MSNPELLKNMLNMMKNAEHNKTNGKEIMQKMISEYNKNKKSIFFNPKKKDNANSTFMRNIVRENMYETRSGKYTKFNYYKHEKIPYTVCDPSPTNYICDVKVVYEHALDIAKQYSIVGNNIAGNINSINPAVLNIVSREFTGNSFESSEDFRDEMMNIRTTFFMNKNEREKIFPINDNYCVYTKGVNVIRDANPTDALSIQECYKVCFITASPVIHPIKISEFTSENYINTYTIIENIFQTAINYGHKTLILVPFGHDEDNNPFNDIISLYNLCIIRYGHKFKTIIFAIPKFYPEKLYEIYKKGIIIPNELPELKDIDKKYDNIIKQEILKKKIEENTEEIVNSFQDSNE